MGSRPTKPESPIAQSEVRTAIPIAQHEVGAAIPIQPILDLIEGYAVETCECGTGAVIDVPHMNGMRVCLKPLEAALRDGRYECRTNNLFDFFRSIEMYGIRSDDAHHFTITNRPHAAEALLFHLATGPYSHAKRSGAAYEERKTMLLNATFSERVSRLSATYAGSEFATATYVALRGFGEVLEGPRYRTAT